MLKVVHKQGEMAEMLADRLMAKWDLEDKAEAEIWEKEIHKDRIQGMTREPEISLSNQTA